MKPLTHRIVTVGFILFLAVPLLAGAAGVRPELIENRNPTGYPEFGPGAAFDTDTYEQLNDYLSDRLPFRDRAIEVEARIDLDVFGDNPNPLEVRIGSDGWLYAASSIDVVCWNLVSSVDEIVDRFDTMRRIVEASGRTFRLTIAPDKVSIYPEQLGAAQNDLPRCEREGRAQLHRRLQAGAVPGFVDLWGAFERGKGDKLFYAADTHWTELGASIYVRELVESLAPGLWDEEAVVRSPGGGREAGLWASLGIQSFETADRVDVRRPGLTITRLEEWFVSTSEEYRVGAGEEQLAVANGELMFTVDQVGRSRYSHREVDSAGVPLIEGTTLFIQDSFMWDPLEMIPQYFAESVFDHWRIVPTDRVARDLRASDTVVVQTVERLLYGRLREGDLIEAMLKALRQDLPGYSVALGTAAAARSSDVTIIRNGDAIKADSDEARIVIDDLAPAPAGTDRYLVLGIDAPAEASMRWLWSDDEGRVGAERSLVLRAQPGPQLLLLDMRHAPTSFRFVLRPNLAGVELSLLQVIDLP